MGHSCGIYSVLCEMLCVHFLPSSLLPQEPHLTIPGAHTQKHHYHELPDNVRKPLGTASEDFLKYFTDRFPKLFLRVYSVVSSSPLRTESTFRSFFELAK